MESKIIHGDSLFRLAELPESSVDAVVTDPPYGLAFMGKKWDYDVPTTELWVEALRVLKPGGHLLAFFGTRTYHRGVVRIEDAGFEIRDQVMWIYGSGFPKSHNLKEEWQGWGTALKPANEPICLARKPLEKGLTVAENVLKWGTGAINVDGCRIAAEKPIEQGRYGRGDAQSTSYHNGLAPTDRTYVSGRWPANVLFDEAAAKLLDAQSGEIKTKLPFKPINQMTFGAGDTNHKGKKYTSQKGLGITIPGASRFFYVAKASKNERSKGLDKTFLVWENDAWEKPDLKLALTGMLQLAKDISGDLLMDASSWNIEQFGLSTTDQSQMALMSTIKTALKLTIELKTWNASPGWSIRESIQDAIVTIAANGLSLAESAEAISQLPANTTGEKTASVLGVVRAQLLMLSPIKDAAKTNNFHATVKPIKLMEYLIKLITPPGGTVLDPFMGSGSTGVACKNLGFSFIGIELNEEYIEIASRRINNGI